MCHTVSFYRRSQGGDKGSIQKMLVVILQFDWSLRGPLFHLETCHCQRSSKQVYYTDYAYRQDDIKINLYGTWNAQQHPCTKLNFKKVLHSAVPLCSFYLTLAANSQYSSAELTTIVEQQLSINYARDGNCLQCEFFYVHYMQPERSFNVA